MKVDSSQGKISAVLNALPDAGPHDVSAESTFQEASACANTLVGKGFMLWADDSEAPVTEITTWKSTEDTMTFLKMKEHIKQTYYAIVL